MSWVEKFVEMLFPLDIKQLDIDGAFSLKYQHLPPSIFKYRSVDADGHALKNLEEDTVWLSDPRSLNDPYDCTCTVDMGRMMQDSLRNLPPQLVAELPSDKFPLESLGQLSKSADPIGFISDVLLSEYPSEEREKILNAIRQTVKRVCDGLVRNNSENLKGAFKLCSFSERLDSILMWSHYAANHKGFCIEYDARKFSMADYQSRFLFPVIYTDQLYDATPYMMNFKECGMPNNLHLILAGLLKATDWQYEKEWRLLFPHGVLKEDCAYPMGSPKAVYLGAQIEGNNQKRIIEICSRRNIPVKKMRLSATQYLMEPCAIEDADRVFFSRKYIG